MSVSVSRTASGPAGKRAGLDSASSVFAAALAGLLGDVGPAGARCSTGAARGGVGVDFGAAAGAAAGGVVGVRVQGAAAVTTGSVAGAA
ncbi:hypothetical protein [Embleya scabrispora]|uniref:hypothetical protein n=1 Tax=Embleya scabrispora TaxID=159449 RepID=UPI001319CDCA|nr:hypothetical protein [Embleya scabrispora]MYS87787.1 hypothetical protein [Streptomyces sp. SID5474]